MLQVEALPQRGYRVRQGARITQGMIGLALLSSMFLPLCSCSGFETGWSYIKTTIDDAFTLESSYVDDAMHVVLVVMLYFSGVTAGIAALARARGWKYVAFASSLIYAGATIAFAWVFPPILVCGLWYFYRNRHATLGLSLCYFAEAFVWSALQYWWLMGDAEWGGAVTVTCHALLLLAVFVETAASTATLHGFWRALVIGASLEPNRLGPGVCHRCRYPRGGIESLRCPECGQKWTEEKVGSTGQSLAQLPGGKY